MPCPSPGDLPNPGIESASLMSLYWQAGSLPLVPRGKLEVLTLGLTKCDAEECKTLPHFSEWLGVRSAPPKQPW